MDGLLDGCTVTAILLALDDPELEALHAKISDPMSLTPCKGRDL